MFAFAALVIFLLSQVHEVTHVQIGSYYGCDGRIVWDFLDVNKSFTELMNGEQTAFMSTHWDSNCMMTESQTLAHSMNEVVGYNVILMLELIFIMIVFSMMFGKKIMIRLHKKRKGKMQIVEMKG